MQKIEMNEWMNRVVITRNFERAERLEVPVHEVPMSEQPMPSGELLIVPISFAAIVWVLLFVMHFNFWKSVRSRISTIQTLHQLPCTNCKYFKNNPYLKCAVQPDKVLRSESTQCPDYAPNESTLPS